MTRCREATGCLLVGLLLALPVAAQPKVTTAVVALEPSLETQSLVDWSALGAAAAGDPRLTYVAPGQAASPELATRGKKAAEARAAYAAALAAFDDASMAAALEQANVALGLFEASDLSQAFPDFVECIALKALILQVTGAPGTESELRRLFTLAPGLRLDSPRYNPGFTKLAESARTRLGRLSRVPLEVRTPGASALAYVDGVFHGVTPVVVRGLPPGPHVVTLISPGTAVFQATAVAGPGKVFEASIPSSAEASALKAHLESLRTGLRNGKVSTPALKLARWSGAEEVLMVALAPVDGGVRATFTRLLPDGRRIEGSHTGGLTAVEERVKAALALLDQQPPDLTPPPRSSTREEPVVSLRQGPAGWEPKTWGLVSLGAAAAAATGGVLLGLSAQQQALDTRKVPQTDDAGYERARTAALQTAGLANGLYGVALVGAGAGTWLLLTNRWPWGRAATSPEEQRPVRMSVVPLQQGGAVLMEGRFH